MVDPFSWPMAFTIVGGISVAAISIAGFLIQYFRKESPWKDSINKLNARIIKLEAENKLTTVKFDDVQKGMDDHDERDQRDFTRVESKLEKLTDLVIELLTDSKDDATR